MAAVRSKGVTILGVTIVVGALYQMCLVFSSGYLNYANLHQEYSSDLIFMRYVMTWAVKVIGLILGIALLRLNDLSRKLLIVYYLLIMVTVHLKHAYPAYLLHMQNLDAAFHGGPYPGITFVSLVWPALIFQRSVDIIFGFIVIVFLTRPKVRQQFQSKNKD